MAAVMVAQRRRGSGEALFGGEREMQRLLSEREEGDNGREVYRGGKALGV